MINIRSNMHVFRSSGYDSSRHMVPLEKKQLPSFGRFHNGCVSNLIIPKKHCSNIDLEYLENKTQIFHSRNNNTLGIKLFIMRFIVYT